MVQYNGAPLSKKGPSWSWSYGSLMYSYLSNLVPITTNAVSLSVTCGRWVVYSGTPISFSNKTDRYDITEILLKVTLNIITTNPSSTVENEGPVYIHWCSIEGNIYYVNIDCFDDKRSIGTDRLQGSFHVSFGYTNKHEIIYPNTILFRLGQHLWSKS